MLLSLDSVPPRLTLKASPEHFAELTEVEGIVPAPYVGRYKWILLERLNVVPRRELEELIKKSYEMVAAKGKSARKGMEKSSGPKATPKKPKR